MSDNTKSCKGCRQIKEIYKFFDNNKEIRATCKACRERTKFSKRQKREQNVAETFTTHKENAIPCQQLPDIIYEQLLIANGTEEDFLENNNFQFAIEQTLFSTHSFYLHNV
jgi:CMP-N-acetylneuraminic acid synthetase